MPPVLARSLALAAAFASLLAGGSARLRATTFHCDPARGGLEGDGSAAHPWGALEEVVARNLIRWFDADGRCRNPDAPCGPGDTLLLHSGWHGVLRIDTGYNPRPVTIAAAPGEKPQLGWIEIRRGARWILRGLAVSPSLAPAKLERVPRHLVSLGEHGGEADRELVVEDCFIFTAPDSSGWQPADWMGAASGIWLGRHGRDHVARNNHVLNTRFGIALCAPGCLAEGNIIENFSADGLRLTRDDQVARLNVIKNVFLSARDGDPNHDDGIQAFLFNVGRGTLRRLRVEDNLILERETAGLPWPNSLQGIGFFDGPLVDFVVRGNVVRVNAYHGITLGDAQGCLIESNVVAAATAGREGRPWIMLGRKRHDPVGNTVRHNRAPAFHLEQDRQVRAEDNEPVTPAIFTQRLRELRARIDARFGPRHPVSGQPRLLRDR
ncbi:MAG: hypothetical protein D6766_09050 [Verrucomicrobia bacterium]|nr:MAG: hypothetical protein D6766_09050 [Verrucomicrobiota bacterium]